jgi:hypothetical protein
VFNKGIFYSQIIYVLQKPGNCGQKRTGFGQRLGKDQAWRGTEPPQQVSCYLGIGIAGQCRTELCCRNADAGLKQLTSGRNAGLTFPAFIYDLSTSYSKNNTQQPSMDVQGVFFPLLAFWTCKVSPLPPPALWTCLVYPCPLPAVGTCRMYPLPSPSE